MDKRKTFSYRGTMTKNRVNEEKLLNEMFVLLEYSDNFYEFVANLSKEAYEELRHALKVREMKDDAGRL